MEKNKAQRQPDEQARRKVRRRTAADRGLPKTHAGTARGTGTRKRCRQAISLLRPIVFFEVTLLLVVPLSACKTEPEPVPPAYRCMPVLQLLWGFLSVPADKDTSQFAATPLVWTAPTDRARRDSIFGPLPGEEGAESCDYLRVVFTPDSSDSASWAGVTFAPCPEGMNLEGYDSLVVVYRSRADQGMIHVDAATRMDEDVPRRTRQGTIAGCNGFEDTEDRNGNGVLDSSEDAGLDGVHGVDSLMVPGDDGNDDRQYPYAGTEGNRRLDQEDKNGDGYSNQNDYFEVSISAVGFEYSTSLFNGWKRVAVPICSEGLCVEVGTPDWAAIPYVRLWVDG